jgi:ribosomal protein S18 acetylase RimI-like enzyme
MKTEFRKAVLPDELKRLVQFDGRIFSKADRFRKADWEAYESYWMIVAGKTVGCCAFEKNVDFREDGRNAFLRGSLYIATTGISPKHQGLGFGSLLKAWQVSYARYHGFTRVVTNTRRSNAAMIALNRKYGFRIIRTTPRYYSSPIESTVVMELRLT